MYLGGDIQFRHTRFACRLSSGSSFGFWASKRGRRNRQIRADLYLRYGPYGICV